MPGATIDFHPSGDYFVSFLCGLPPNSDLSPECVSSAQRGPPAAPVATATARSQNSTEFVMASDTLRFRPPAGVAGRRGRPLCLHIPRLSAIPRAPACLRRAPVDGTRRRQPIAHGHRRAALYNEVRRIAARSNGSSPSISAERGRSSSFPMASNSRQPTRSSLGSPREASNYSWRCRSVRQDWAEKPQFPPHRGINRPTPMLLC